MTKIPVSEAGVTELPLLYDGCCKAGGATKGYQVAGFRVIGIDNEPQPHYCGDGFILMDILEFLDRYTVGDFERAVAFHTSPPCQFVSKASQQWRKAGRQYPELIDPIRERLIKTGKPFIIENVVGEPYLKNPLKLNGTFFHLRLRRTRYFETSFPIELVLLPREESAHFRKMGRAIKEGEILTPVGHFSNIPYARRITGFDWMNQAEIAQAIPWQYTEFIGKQLINYFEANK